MEGYILGAIIIVCVIFRVLFHKKFGKMSKQERRFWRDNDRTAAHSYSEHGMSTAEAMDYYTQGEKPVSKPTKFVLIFLVYVLPVIICVILLKVFGVF